MIRVLVCLSAIVLHDNTRAATNQLNVKVMATQFAWTFTYPNGKTYPNLRVPLGRQTLLTMESSSCCVYRCP